MSTSTTWKPEDWKNYPVKQLPEYPDQKLFNKVYKELKNYPPLVTSWEVEDLKQKLVDAQHGRAFLLQGGDCAETFDNCTSPQIVNLLKVLLQMSFIMIHEMEIPVIRVGRLAGQYAKPRSSDTENVNGQELPSYRGDLINSIEPTLEKRTPNPKRMLQGYQKSALTLNFVRALTEGGGFADLHHPEYWELDFMRRNKYYKEYGDMVNSITHAVRFVETITNNNLNTLKQVQMYTSHETLNLHYDGAQTRRVPHKDGWYNLSTHLPWVGNRTRDLDGAHIHYLSGISNPIGIKVGPPFDDDEVLRLIEKLNPKGQDGKIVLITRMGMNHIHDRLPKFIQKVTSEGLPVIWSCDPMHGNTYSTEENLKTRNFDAILDEIRTTFAIHREEKSHLGGVHLELTGDNVTECVGGAKGLKADGLKSNYQTFCDPRLNYQQSLEMAFLIAKEWKQTVSEKKQESFNGVRV